jgi:hypothetical protein
MRGLRAACGAADPFRANHQPHDSQALGLTVPTLLLAQADQVIE